MAEFFNSTIQRLRHLQMRAMVMVVSYSGFGGIAVDAPGSMPVHRLQSLLKLPIGDRLIAEAIFGHLEIGRPFLEATFTDLAEGFGMAARRRIRARHAAMTVFDASKKYAVRPSDSCGNKLASHNRSSTLWRNEWGANQQKFADSTHVSGAAPRPFNHGAITRTCYARNGPPNGVPSGPLLARRLLAKPLPHIPEVSRGVTAAEFGADAKLDVAALWLATKPN